MESKKGWAFVALYNGKKVKKYVTACKELDKHEWITEVKFWFRDENDTHCEGIVLANEDNEQTLRAMITKKNPRCPHNAFNPFPDPNIKPIDTVEKWKKRLAKIAMTDSSMPKKYHEALGEKEIPNSHAAETISIKATIHKEEKELTTSTKPEKLIINHNMSSRETELRQKKESMGSALKQLHNSNEIPTNPINEAEISPEVSSEEDELSFYSKNKDMQYVRRRTLSFSKPEKKMINHRFVIYPNQLKKNKREASNQDMVSKKKYYRLLQKYKLLSGIFSEQRNQYTKDLHIQHLAQCLYKAIEERYHEEEEESGED